MILTTFVFICLHYFQARIFGHGGVVELFHPRVAAGY